MLAGYKILTITHRRSQLKELGQFAVQANDDALLRQKLEELKQQFELGELMYLSTCNRIMYFFYQEGPLKDSFVTRFIKAVNPGIKQDTFMRLHDYIDLHIGEDAVRHLFEVSASIDSLVVGEREILRQVRQAYNRSKDWGLTADHLRLAMGITVEAAKEVYNQTRIGEKPISVVSLAIQKLLATKLPRTSRILLIGAGQTNTLVAKFLVKNEFTNVKVFNRSIEKADLLAEKFGGRGHTLQELPYYREGFDCIIICTGSTRALINTELYKQLLNGEQDKKVLIDLAIPYNIDQEVVKQFPVEYIEIEGIRCLAKENLGFREQEVSKAKALLDLRIRAFHDTFQQRRIEKAMRQVPSEIKAIKSHAMNVVFKKELDTLDEESRELLERMMSYMEKRCISIPMQAAKKSIH
ncbi:MAG: glutamyl-tRNA reductase [Bacteroidota bacterium]